MVLGFTIRSDPTRAAPPHPDGFEPHHWLQHQRFSFLYIPVTEDGSSHSSQFFYGERCGDHGKQFRASGSVGNVNKHVIHKHKDEWDRSRPATSSNKPSPILDELEARLLVLEENLPFTFIEAPRLKSIMHVNTDRKRLLQFLWPTKDDVADASKGKLTLLLTLFSLSMSGKMHPSDSTLN
jgi:hypothetical protein